MRKIAMTFAGRKKFLEILFTYVERYKNHIDEYRIYAATDNKEDLDYIKEWANGKSYVRVIWPDKEKYTSIDHNGLPYFNPEPMWNDAWKDCAEEDCVYVKLDDDIVYIDENLFTDFIDFRIANPQYPMVYPLITNNSFCSWLTQEKMGFEFPVRSVYNQTWSAVSEMVKIRVQKDGIPERMTDLVGENILHCPAGWGNISFASAVHENFLNHLENSRLEEFKTTRDGSTGYLIESYAPISINCCSWLGSSLKEFTSKYGEVFHDETWVSTFVPMLEEKPNFVYFGSAVAHFSYYVQQDGLLKTNILQRYKSLCAQKQTKMKKLTLRDLETTMRKLTSINFYKLLNVDGLWKNSAILKYIDDNDIKFESLLDVGAGSSPVSMYLLLNKEFEYYGVDISENENVIEEWLIKNGRNTDRVKYFIQDFLDFKTDQKFDLVTDGCAITHFDSNTSICANDGILKSGKSIYSSLTDNGIFICVSDCIPENVPNHRGEINKEYISAENMIKCYEMAGLELINEPWYLDRNSINADVYSYAQQLSEICRPNMAYDPATQHYDRVLLAFRKRK